MKKQFKKVMGTAMAASMILSMGIPAAAEDGNFNAEGFPIVNEPVTLRVLASKHNLTDPYTELQIFKDLEEKTNVKIEWEYAEGDDWNTQKPLLLASGDLPDVFLGNAIGESDVISNSELFMDMTDLIEQYAPNVKAMFEEDPMMKTMATSTEGTILGLPHQMPCRPMTFDMMFINQQWLDNLGLETPTTIDEFYEVLKAFKEQDANGNGDPNDEIPMSFLQYNDLTGWLSLIGAFGEDVVDSMSSTYLSMNDGKVAYIPVQEHFKDAVKWMQKLYSEGLIDVEAFTHDWTTYPARLNPEGDPIVGVGFHWSVQTGVGLEKAEQYKPLMPLEGPDGARFWRYKTDMVKSGKYFAEISASCENPEIAMRWLDAIYDQEVSMQMFYGPIGKTIEKHDDGTYEVLAPTDGLNAESWAWKFSMGDTCPGYVGDAMSAKITPPEDVRQKLEADKEYQNYLKDEYLPLVNLTKDQSDELSILGIDLNTYFKETVSGWIVNGGDIDAEWDGYVEQMQKMGYERYEEVYQEAYEAYVAE